MAVVQASKDIKRLTEERNAAMQEYSMIMAERDTVHKEIEKLQDEVANTNNKMKDVESRTKVQDEEVSVRPTLPPLPPPPKKKESRFEVCTFAKENL